MQQSVKIKILHVPKRGALHMNKTSTILIYFLRLNFLRWRLNRRISQKMAPRRKIQLYGIHIYSDHYLFTLGTWT